MIWFTADTHFGHANIIRYCDRPFETKQEHDETLIRNWNAVVSPKDHVYHMGDLGFGSPEYLRRTLAKLHGQIHLIKGNHDRNVVEIMERFVFIKDVHFLKTQYKNRKVEIYLSHYAHRTWPKSHIESSPSYHAYGHSHGKLPPYGRSMDVGVDAWNYQPISLEFFIEEIDRNNIDVEKENEHVILEEKDC